MLKYFITSSFFLYLLLHTDSTVVYKSLQMGCFPNPEFIQNSTCRLKPINWYKSVYDMQCDIIDKLDNVSLHFQSFVKDYANHFQPFVIEASGNICDALDKKKSPLITSILINLLKKVSNVNHSCPFTGRLIAKNIYINEKLLPIVFPHGIYKLVFNYYEGYPPKNVGTNFFVFQVMEKLNPRSDGTDPSRKRNTNTSKV